MKIVRPTFIGGKPFIMSNLAYWAVYSVLEVLPFNRINPLNAMFIRIGSMKFRAIQWKNRPLIVENRGVRL